MDKKRVFWIKTGPRRSASSEGSISTNRRQVSRWNHSTASVKSVLKSSEKVLPRAKS